MILKYGAEIDNSAIDKNLNRITNQIYKLLPSREEKSDWQKPLTTIIEELAGMDRMLFDQHDILFPLLCKLEGLLILTQPEDFYMFRITIFECLSLMSNLKKNLCQD